MSNAPPRDDGNNNNLILTYQNNQVGEANITVTAIDGGNLSTSITFKVVVTNPAPIFTSDPVTNISEDTNTSDPNAKKIFKTT